MKRNTPWGSAHTCTNLSPDGMVVKVSTAEHGGIGVAPTIQLAPHIHECAVLDDDGWRWFEEDLGWAAAVVALPDLFDGMTHAEAKDTLQHCMPQTFIAHFGIELTGATSRALAQVEFELATKNNFIVTGAFTGGVYWDVPERFVYACGWRRADEATAGFLVPLDQYVNPGRLVLDQFPRWEPDRNLPYLRRHAEFAAE